MQLVCVCGIFSAWSESGVRMCKLGKKPDLHCCEQKGNSSAPVMKKPGMVLTSGTAGSQLCKSTSLSQPYFPLCSSTPTPYTPTPTLNTQAPSRTASRLTFPALPPREKKMIFPSIFNRSLRADTHWASPGHVTNFRRPRLGQPCLNHVVGEQERAGSPEQP